MVILIADVHLPRRPAHPLLSLPLRGTVCVPEGHSPQGPGTRSSSHRPHRPQQCQERPGFAAACRSEGLAAVFGIEITTREEVHALTLFPTVETALEAGDEAYMRLESEPFDPEFFGDQVWVDENEEIEGMLDKLCILGATDFSLEDLGPWCRSRGGILIPAHIDRPAFGVLGQLGFLPEGPFEAVECTEPLSEDLTDPWPVIASSDAHRPEDIGCRCLEFEALVMALESGKTRALYGNK